MTAPREHTGRAAEQFEADLRDSYHALVAEIRATTDIPQALAALYRRACEAEGASDVDDSITQQLRAGWTVEGYAATRITVSVDDQEQEVVITVTDDDTGGGFADAVRLDPLGAHLVASVINQAAGLIDPPRTSSDTNSDDEGR